jgi:hypothetical protein
LLELVNEKARDMAKDKLTRADRENVDRQKERDLGHSVGQKVPGAGSDHENVSDTEDTNTPANQLEPARLRIGHPTE